MLITTLFGEQLLCHNFSILKTFRSFDRIKADKMACSCVLCYDETIIYNAKLFLPFSSEIFLPFSIVYCYYIKVTHMRMMSLSLVLHREQHAT